MKTLIISIVLVPIIIGQVVSQVQSKCDIPISSETANNPASRELHKAINSFKAMIAIRSGHIKVAEKYWNEIVCLESMVTTAAPSINSNLEQRLESNLLHIIRDFCSSSVGYAHGFHNILQFIKSINAPPTMYDFLLNEIKSYDQDLMYGQSLIFDVASTIKAEFGQDSASFKKLPRIAQLLTSGQRVKLRNNATNNYLFFNGEIQSNANNNADTPQLMNQTVNNVATISIPRNSRISMDGLTWEFKSYSKAPSTKHYVEALQEFEISNNGPCPNGNSGRNANCAKLLILRGLRKEHHGPPHPHHFVENQSNKANKDSPLVMLPTPHSKFIINLESEDMISIRFFDQTDRYYLSETSNGQVEAVPINRRDNYYMNGMFAQGGSEEKIMHYWIVEE